MKGCILHGHTGEIHGMPLLTRHIGDIFGKRIKPLSLLCSKILNSKVRPKNGYSSSLFSNAIVVNFAFITSIWVIAMKQNFQES